MSEEFENITLELFYDILKRHDWHYAMSDDRGVYERGSRRDETIRRIVKAHGEEHAQLYAQFIAWARKGGPQPELPNDTGPQEAAQTANDRD